jgi:hypothetical protein
VPAANAGTSKIPIGPFQKHGLRVARACSAKRVERAGPMSTPMSSCASASSADDAPGAEPSVAVEATQSTGSTSSTPRCLRAPSTSRAISTRSSSTSERPVGSPWRGGR